MNKLVMLCAPLVVLAVWATGCAFWAPVVTSIKSAGVDRIPTKIGFYPILSSPAPVYMRVPRGGHGPMPYPTQSPTSEGATEPSSESKPVGDEVLVVPPTYSELSITEESQILTGQITAKLASVGFTIKELPVEYLAPDADRESVEVGGGFTISMNLMNRMREEYGLDAIVVGSAFFFIEQLPQRSYPQKNVVSAHLKVIDTRTLEVIAQVVMPYTASGVDLNIVSDDLSSRLAELAGIAVP